MATPEALIQVIWRRRAIVGAFTLAGLVLSIVYLLVARKQYTAESRIYVDNGGPRLVNEPSGDRISENYLNTQCELIRSTPILSLALGSLEGKPLETLEGVSNRFEYLKKHLSAQPGKKDDLIYVSFEGPDAIESSVLVNNIVDAYIAFQTTHRKSTASEVLVILRNEMEKRETELADKKKQLLALQQQAGVLSYGNNDRSNPILQRLTTLSDALTNAHLETINAKSRYEQSLLSLNGDPVKLQQVQQSDTLALSPSDEELARSELFVQQQRLVDLRRQYMPGHPMLRSIEARIDQLRIALVIASKQRWMASRQKEADLQINFDEQQKLALAQSVHTAEYQRLTADIARLEQLNQSLDTRIKETSLTENSGALDINVLEQAVPPTRASSPQSVRVVAFGLVGGLVLGMGAGLLRDFTDRRMRSVDQVKAAMGLPVLGSVPRMPQMLTAAMKALRAHQDPSSDIAEAYRSLRTAVHFGLGDGSARTLLVTSPSMSDGKSTVASNLAIAMAQAGQRVLLIDADLRDPSLHKMFGIDSALGLSNGFNNDGDIHRAIVPTGIPGLQLLPCGPSQMDPSELLNSQRFSDTLNDLAGEYDQVVVDSPPVLAVSDARILGAICDGTLLVISAMRSDRKTAERARDGLVAVGANLLGTVVNEVSPNDTSSADYGYGRYMGRTDKRTTSPAPARQQPIHRRLGGLKMAGPDSRTL